LATLLICAAVLAGCGTAGIPHSSILLRNATTQAIVSTPAVEGSVVLGPQQTLPLQVIRTYKDDGGNTLTSDVTGFASFSLPAGNGVAVVDAFGNLTATGLGSTELVVKFRADALDPYDKVRLAITVQ
jgi:hypothetical protein